MGREIGRIVEVHGVTVKAELFELLPPYLLEKSTIITAPRINTFVKTRVGLDTVICQITGEYNDEKTKGTFSGYFLNLTVKGYIDGNKFFQGLRMLPIVAASVELLDAEDLGIIHEYDAKNSFSIGKSLFDMNREIFLNYNDIIPSHIGIFGNTGSGKSNTLAKILKKYSEVLDNYKNGKLLVFDINNEYGDKAICESKKVFTLSTASTPINKIPFDLSRLKEDDWCILLSATEATQRPVIKSAFKDQRTEEQYAETIRNIIKNAQKPLFNTIRAHMGTYIEGIDYFKWHERKTEFYYEDDDNKFYSTMNEFENQLQKIHVKIPETGLERFLFKLYMATAFHIGYGIQYDYISPMLRRAEKLAKDFEKVFFYSTESIFDNSNIVIIQLGNVNKDMKQIIPAILANSCFEEQVREKEFWGTCTDIMNIVIDEAHNLLYEDSDDYRHNVVALEPFEKIVKEGRKFGTFLWIASQRPSDISQTIISQMHNYFIHKLVNPYDLHKIRKAVAFLDEESMNTITVLGPGECILSGTTVAMPMFLKVNQVEKQYRPNSENLILFGKNGIFD